VTSFIFLTVHLHDHLQ